ncbi:hypothetical protein GCM10009557_58590 [Virgisporangium ochraceum]
MGPAASRPPAVAPAVSGSAVSGSAVAGPALAGFALAGFALAGPAGSGAVGFLEWAGGAWGAVPQVGVPVSRPVPTAVAVAVPAQAGRPETSMDGWASGGSGGGRRFVDRPAVRGPPERASHRLCL